MSTQEKMKDQERIICGEESDETHILFIIIDA